MNDLKLEHFKPHECQREPEKCLFSEWRICGTSTSKYRIRRCVTHNLTILDEPVKVTMTFTFSDSSTYQTVVL